MAYYALRNVYADTHTMQTHRQHIHTRVYIQDMHIHAHIFLHSHITACVRRTTRKIDDYREEINTQTATQAVTQTDKIDRQTDR